jgi:hypothetical protein
MFDRDKLLLEMSSDHLQRAKVMMKNSLQLSSGKNLDCGLESTWIGFLFLRGDKR